MAWKAASSASPAQSVKVSWSSAPGSSVSLPPPPPNPAQLLSAAEPAAAPIRLRKVRRSSVVIASPSSQAWDLSYCMAHGCARHVGAAADVRADEGAGYRLRT